MGLLTFTPIYPTGTELTATTERDELDPLGSILLVAESTIGVGSRLKEIGIVEGDVFNFPKVYITGSTHEEVYELKESWLSFNHCYGTILYTKNGGGDTAISRGPFSVLVESVKETGNIGKLCFLLQMSFKKVVVFD